MFTTNPFTPLTAFVSPAAMQGYIILMIIAVAIGTAFDLLHGKKVKFFLQDRRRAKAAAKLQLSTVDMAAIATRTPLSLFRILTNPSNRWSNIRELNPMSRRRTG